MASLTREKAYILTGILLALFLGALDQTIVSTALPRIVEDLHGIDRYAWVATAYMVASTALVPIYGKLADMISRKKLEIFAVITFLLGSFLCGIAGEWGSLPLIGDGMNQLILFRAIQGVGGAGLFSLAFIIIADLFPPAERGKYQGFVGAVFGVSSVLGPYIGGLLTDHAGGWIPGVAGWRWVFYVNVPFGAMALWFLVTKMGPLIPETGNKRVSTWDALLLLIGLVTLVMALQLDKRAYAWTGYEVLTLGAIAVISLTGFTYRTYRSDNPLLDLNLLRMRVFTTSILALFILGACFFSILIFLPLFMVNVVGVSATQAGVSLIPLSLGLVAGSVVSGQLVSRFGHYKWWMLGGSALLFVGVALLTQMTPAVSFGKVTLYIVLCGVGLGPSTPLFTLAIQNAVPRKDLGQATSASQFFRQIGASLGGALLGAMMGATLGGYLASQLPAGDQSVSADIIPGISEESIMQRGGTDVMATTQAAYDELFEEVSTAVAGSDRSAQQALSDNPLLPAAIQALLASGDLAPDDIPLIRSALVEEAVTRGQALQGIIRDGFSQAITGIYLVTLLLVGASMVVTLFVPEIPLRKTNEPAQMAEPV